MKVLLVGHRIGLARALEKMNITYSLWATKLVKNKLRSKQVIIHDFPVSYHELESHCEDLSEITHVIAGVESAVIPASLIRGWLDLKRNPHSLILKCTDKLQMKSYLSDKKIPMTDFSSGEGQTYEKLIERLGLPLVCKPKRDSGGRGINFIYNREDYDLYQHPDNYFERAIKAKEGSIESFIQDKQVLFTNITEYYKVGACNKVPSSIDEQLKATILLLNKKVIQSMNIEWGMTHLEYYLCEDGILFGEIALRPPGGYIMEALSLAYDKNFWELFAAVELGLKDYQWPDHHEFAASIVIYPGEGKIKSINGIEKVKKLKSLVKLKVKMEAGDVINKRDGVGQDYGYVLMKHHDQDTLDLDIRAFYDNFKVDLRPV